MADREAPEAHHPNRVPVLTFLGATETVTGSRFLIDTATARVLVDCGLYQGIKELRQRNWAPFPVDPTTIDAVVLTHAHIDHVGYVPVLTSRGYEGPIFASAQTVALAGIVLPDSGHLQEEEARYANLRGYSKHKPALPLYTEDDARQALTQFRAVGFGEPIPVAEGVRVTFQPGGHILGSSIVTVELAPASASARSRRVVFSGDLGRAGHPILAEPHVLGDADVVVVESTYGDRTHDDEGALDLFAQAITRTAARGGVVVIPAFAVDRTEVLLVHLKTLLASGAIPDLPIYVDSPMALAALGVYRRAIGEHGPEIRDDIRAADDPFGHATIREVHEVAESMELDRLLAPAIIISASGMATGGRVLHHLARYLPDHRATIVLVGFQAEQTRGRQLADGAHQVKLLGKYVRVAAEVVDLPSFSVHADREGLLRWLQTAEHPPDACYVVHGEPASAESLRAEIGDRLGWTAVVPTYGERVRLD
ncbi:MAG TPA: MBL fold metallo-hydrolase [Acidimicrobiales bacterium]